MVRSQGFWEIAYRGAAWIGSFATGADSINTDDLVYKTLPKVILWASHFCLVGFIYVQFRDLSCYFSLLGTHLKDVIRCMLNWFLMNVSFVKKRMRGAEKVDLQHWLPFIGC